MFYQWSHVKDKTIKMSCIYNHTITVLDSNFPKLHKKYSLLLASKSQGYLTNVKVNLQMSRLANILPIKKS